MDLKGSNLGVKEYHFNIAASDPSCILLNTKSLNIAPTRGKWLVKILYAGFIPLNTPEELGDHAYRVVSPCIRSDNGEFLSLALLPRANLEKAGFVSIFDAKAYEVTSKTDTLRFELQTILGKKVQALAGDALLGVSLIRLQGPQCVGS